MSDLLSLLQAFDRKERFFLVGMALGKQSFALSESFRGSLGEALAIQIPKDAFVAMDYHLDWLAASIQLTNKPGAPDPYKRDPEIHNATQQEIDLLIAFEGNDGCHIIMIEAKGVTPFSNKQFGRKVARLKMIFERPHMEAGQAIPHFALVSPRRPQHLKLADSPNWIRGADRSVAWMELPLPTTLNKVMRCLEDGTTSEKGTHWKVVPERGAGRSEPTKSMPIGSPP